MYKATRGSDKILVTYNCDSNYVHTKNVLLWTAYQLLVAYQHVYKILVTHGFRPHLQRLDNRATCTLVSFHGDRWYDFYFTFAHSHHHNTSERIIHIFKNHFIIYYVGCNLFFNILLWDKLLPQTLITLNLVWPSHVNLKIFVYVQVHG